MSPLKQTFLMFGIIALVLVFVGNLDGDVHREEVPNVEHCEDLMDQIFLTDGQFEYGMAIERLERWKNSEEIDLEEYLNLLDAVNNRNQDGHYRKSLICQRALAHAGYLSD